MTLMARGWKLNSYRDPHLITTTNTGTRAEKPPVDFGAAKEFKMLEPCVAVSVTVVTVVCTSMWTTVVVVITVVLAVVLVVGAVVVVNLVVVSSSGTKRSGLIDTPATARLLLTAAEL